MAVSVFAAQVANHDFNCGESICLRKGGGFGTNGFKDDGDVVDIGSNESIRRL